MVTLSAVISGFAFAQIGVVYGQTTVTGPITVNAFSPTLGAYLTEAIRSVATGSTGNRVTAGQFEGLGQNLSWASVWGVSTEAWSGTKQTAPANGTQTLVGGEFAVISQAHNNQAALVGLDLVFKNRPDGSSAPFSGKGWDYYNRFSQALYISSQPRSSAGERSGWQSAIKLAPNSLDVTVDKNYTAIIDLSDVATDNSGQNPYMLVWGHPQASVKFGMRYNSSLQRVEFIRDIEGSPVIKGWIDMSFTASPHGL